MTYIGVDLHQLFCYMMALDASGEVERQGRVANDAASLQAYFARWAKPVDLCEVHYGYLKSDDLATANEAWEKATMLLGVLQTMTEDFVKRVGRWKAQKGLPLVDSFVAASAEEHAAVLVTADHTDFDPIQEVSIPKTSFALNSWKLAALTSETSRDPSAAQPAEV